MKKFLLTLLSLMVIFTFVLVISSCSTPEPQPLSQLPPPGQTTLSPHGGELTTPAAVGTPTVVPKGTKPEDHVKNYYEAYKAGRWEEAFDLLPAVSKAREKSPEAFGQSRSQMPIESYSISTAIETAEGTRTVVKIPVKLKSSGMEFQTTWVFEKNPDGTHIVKETQTALGGQ